MIIVPPEDEKEIVSEFFYKEQSSKDSGNLILKKLSTEECKEIVANQVSKVVLKYIHDGSKVIVGITL